MHKIKIQKKVDNYFNTYQYVNAIEEYLKLVQSKNADSYVYEQLANSYFHVYNPKEAANWYEKAVESKADAETYYKNAQTLKSLGKYKEANKQLDIFSNLLPNDSRAIEHKKNPNYIPSLANKSKLFDLQNTKIKNEGSNDFGFFLTDDNELYFACDRNKNSKTDKWNNQPCLDIFKSIRNADGTLTEPKAVNSLNTPYHDGPVTISNDGNTMFFARDGNSEGKSKKTNDKKTKVGQQGIYKASKVNGEWTNIETLPFNSVDYSVTNPSLSKDGKTLYFASNMPGGIGESDIWKVTINDSKYSEPINLGNKVNTPAKENFPFITEDNILYYSTTGKQGYGGLDVYQYNLDSNNEPVNIGKPVNTEHDDFSFGYNKKHNVAFFSSNRDGNDGLFAATPVCNAEILVEVLNNKTNEIIKNAEVSILDAMGNIITSKITNESGKVNYDIECQKDYKLKVSANNFDTTLLNFEKTSNAITNVKIPLNPKEVIITDKEVILKNVYFDYNKSNITAQGANELDKLILVLNENPTMVIFIKSHTDSKGSEEYNLKLSEQRAQSTVQYIVSKGIIQDIISGKGVGNSEPKISCGLNCNEEEHAQNRRSEFLIIKNK